jgi:hypothetical protein
LKAISKAALAYFSIVFAIGFVLGAFRVSFAAPLLGESLATIVELPVILAASWFVCRWVMARWKISRAPVPRFAVGALAFALLIAAEIAVGVIGFRRTVTQILAGYDRMGPLLGLVGQVLFGLFPRIQASPMCQSQARGK